jgi:hypothetical protein
MVAARTTHKGVYASDILGQDFKRKVDDHLYTQAALGWTAATDQLPMPGTMRPRHVVGVDTSGRSHSVVAATITCDLWATPGITTWQILDDTGTLDTVTPTGLVGEALTL